MVSNGILTEKEKEMLSEVLEASDENINVKRTYHFYLDENEDYYIDLDDILIIGPVSSQGQFFIYSKTLKQKIVLPSSNSYFKKTKDYHTIAKIRKEISEQWEKYLDNK